MQDMQGADPQCAQTKAMAGKRENIQQEKKRSADEREDKQNQFAVRKEKESSKEWKKHRATENRDDDVMMCTEEERGAQGKASDKKQKNEAEARQTAEAKEKLVGLPEWGEEDFLLIGDPLERSWCMICGSSA